MFGGVKKSVYVFLCSLLGVMLFLVLHRIAVFGYLFITTTGVFTVPAGEAYIRFLAIDIITMFFAMLLGSWYGIWLGEYWYAEVYEQDTVAGVLRRLRHKYFSWRSGQSGLKDRVLEVKERLEEDLGKVEALARDISPEILNPVPVKRRIVRKKPAAARRVRKLSNA